MNMLGVPKYTVNNEAALHTAPFDNSQFHKIWISVVCFVLDKFVYNFVEVFMLAWRAMPGENDCGPWTALHGKRPMCRVMGRTPSP
jgi:hypothetical protein